MAITSSCVCQLPMHRAMWFTVAGIMRDSPVVAARACAATKSSRPKCATAARPTAAGVLPSTCVPPLNGYFAHFRRPPSLSMYARPRVFLLFHWIAPFVFRRVGKKRGRHHSYPHPRNGGWGYNYDAALCDSSGGIIVPALPRFPPVDWPSCFVTLSIAYFRAFAKRF